MSDNKPDNKDASAPAARRRPMLLIVGAPVLVLLLGGGGAAVYAMQAGWFGAHGAAAADDRPRLLPKREEARASLGEGGHGEGADKPGAHGRPPPEGQGGDAYASSYYPLEKEFTANLQDSVHFVQVGIAVSTPYDTRVLENIKTHEIAIRSAVLMALGETSEDEVFTAEGKKRIQTRLVKAINAVLQEKEGFGGVSNVYFTNFIVQ